MTIAIRSWWHGPLDVEGLAIGAVQAVVDAVDRLSAAQGGSARASTSAELVRAAFEAPAHVRFDGRAVDPWDDLSGWVRASDGFARLHANYPHHAAALRSALGVTTRRERDAVAAGMTAQEIEDAVVAEGGVAARVRTSDEWASHPHGAATASDPWVDAQEGGERAVPHGGGLPLAGVRVLDLTRVLAGPTCTQTLACLGADVLRVDAPARPEILAQFLMTGMGKRSAEADLGVAAEDVRALLPQADVVVTGARPGALDPFDLSPDQLSRDHPHLVVGSLSAWGTSGPWGRRRGFDSIVQAASGIAELYAAEDGSPGALPAQALDLATGYVLAAEIVGLLARGRSGRVSASLLGAARTLLSAGAPPDPDEVSMGTPMVVVGSPHGTVFLPPPPIMWERRSLERDVAGYGTSSLAWR